MSALSSAITRRNVSICPGSAGDGVQLAVFRIVLHPNFSADTTFPRWCGRPALQSIGAKELFSARLESVMTAKGSAGRKTRSSRNYIVV